MMKPKNFKPGKVLVGFAVIAALALPVLLLKAGTLPLEKAVDPAKAVPMEDFDHKAKQLYSGWPEK